MILAKRVNASNHILLALALVATFMALGCILFKSHSHRCAYN